MLGSTFGVGLSRLSECFGGRMGLHDSRRFEFSTVLGVGIVACVLLASSPTVAAKDRFDFGLRSDLALDYTDNLYRLSDDELAAFDDLQGPTERFFDMSRSDDVIARFGLRGDLDWRLAKKRKVRLRLKGTYYGHAENTIADYPRLEVTLSGDVTKKDKLYGGVDLIYDRFWKNLRVATTGVFAPAVYDQIDARVGYKRDLRKRWTAGLEYRHRTRTYEAPLGARDRDGDYLLGSTGYRVAHGVRGTSALQYGDVTTETIVLPVSGILVDRSYQEWLAAQAFDFRLSKRVDLGLALQFRQRDYSTDDTRDEARFERVDRRVRAAVSLALELSRAWMLETRYRYTDNDSDRIDPTADSDQLGYTEHRFGVVLQYRT